MIRKNNSSIPEDDEEFEKLIDKHVDDVRAYIDNVLIYEYFAFYIANAYSNDALWEDYRLDYEYTGAAGDLTKLPSYEELDIEKLKKILKEKYSLKLTSTVPIKIEETSNH